MRVKFIEFDARREPKTDTFCACCQRDIKVPTRWVFLRNGDPYAIHPADADASVDRHPIGEDCAKRLGLEWTTTTREREVQS